MNFYKKCSSKNEEYFLCCFRQKHLSVQPLQGHENVFARRKTILQLCNCKPVTPCQRRYPNEKSNFKLSNHSDERKPLYRAECEECGK